MYAKFTKKEVVQEKPKVEDSDEKEEPKVEEVVEEEEPKVEKTEQVKKAKKKVVKKKADTTDINENTPKAGADAEDDTTPETGDDAPISLLLMMFLLSGFGICYIIVRSVKVR